MEPARLEFKLIQTILLAASSIANAVASLAPPLSNAYAGFHFKHDVQMFQVEEVFSAFRGLDWDRSNTFAELSHSDFRYNSLPVGLGSSLSGEHYDEELTSGWSLENKLLEERSKTFLYDDNSSGGSATDAYEVREAETLAPPASPVPEPTSFISLLAGLGILAREVWRRHRDPRD